MPSFPNLEWDFLVVDTPPKEDIILGIDFLHFWNPEVNWQLGLITPRHQPTLDHSSSVELSLATTSFPPVNLQVTAPVPFSESMHSQHFPLSSTTTSVNRIFFGNSLKFLEDMEDDLSVQVLRMIISTSDSDPKQATAEGLDEDEETDEIETVMERVPDAYHTFLDVFSKVKADKLPPHRAYDHHIELEGPMPPVGPIYSLSHHEKEALQAYIAENIEKGFICPSTSSTGAPVLFVRKKDGGLQLCVDYCKLNAVTRKNRYPIPPMTHLLTVFSGSTIFSKIDLRGAYNLLRIKEGDEHLTAFRTQFGSFEYLVMPFGLTNAPASFQCLVNDIFADLLTICVVVYLDEILIFSKNFTEHTAPVCAVFNRLWKNNLYAKASKCEFHASSVDYLGYFISRSGIEMDNSKVQKILDWPPPTNKKALQQFLGFSNFYCRFIINYSRKVHLLTALTGADPIFPLSPGALQQFEDLKVAFTKAPVLRHFDFSLQTFLETDASDYALGAVLTQVSLDGSKHPIAFDSRKLGSAELNYEIHNKELLAIVWAIKIWRAYLLSLSSPFEVLTDHLSLKYFMTSKVLTHCQARWAEFLSEFDFTIVYRPGKQSIVPDVLSRRDNVYPKGGMPYAEKNPANVKQLLKQTDFEPSRIFFISAKQVDKQLETLIQSQISNKSTQQIIQKLHKKEQVKSYLIDPDTGLLIFQNRIAIPKEDEQLQLEIL